MADKTLAQKTLDDTKTTPLGDDISVSTDPDNASAALKTYGVTNDNKWNNFYRKKQDVTFVVALSDTTTALTTGTTKESFRAPFAMTLTEVRGDVITAPTGAGIVVDINDGGTSIMTTDKIAIDATETSSKDATTQPTLTDTALADNAVITFDIDQVGSTVAGAGLKVTLIGTRT